MYQKMVGNGQSGDTHREIERQNQQSKTDSCINFMAVSIEGVGGREVGRSGGRILGVYQSPVNRPLALGTTVIWGFLMSRV